MVSQQPPARYIMLGGFLGAGKTTAVGRLAKHLVDRGLDVGVISNDQSHGLVDTVLLRGQGFAVEEITGGCFCCRFDSLVKATEKLSENRVPDVYIAEPVGSCTDLVATVSYPLRRMHGDRFVLAPLSVLIDPLRAARVFGLIPGRSFSSKVVYVYRKQLEEADLIVINKCDGVDAGLRDELAGYLRQAFKQADILCCSALTGTGLDAWFERLMVEECKARPTMELDYDQYAEGEAQLGWLNATVGLVADDPVNGNALLRGLADDIRKRVATIDCEIGHLKITLDSGDPTSLPAAVSLVSSSADIDLRESASEWLKRGTMIINFRAESDPGELRRMVENALEECGREQRGVVLSLEHIESFRPARPEPTHRISVAS